MKILVTGGAGFIGSNFVYHMLDNHSDYKIVCLDALTYAGNLETLDSAMKNDNFSFSKYINLDYSLTEIINFETNAEYQETLKSIDFLFSNLKSSA